MLELQITDNDVSGGSAQVSWCVNQEILKELAAQRVKEPQLLIVVAPEGDAYDHRKEVRKVVPLKDLMTYMEFRSAGKNKIWGVVSYLSKKEAKEKYLSKENGKFSTHVLSQAGDNYSAWLTYNEDPTHQKSNLSTPISVDVPAEIFAKEPAVWEKTWVNHYFRNKVVDQCEFRRRRLFAYLVQPLIILSLMLVTSVILLAGLLTGARSWSPKYLLHPLTYTPLDVGEIWNRGTIFIRHLKEDENGTVFRGGSITPWYFLRSFWSLLFMPALVIPAILLACFGKLQQLATLGGVVGLIFLAFLAVLTIMCYGARMFFWAPQVPKFFVWLIDKLIGQPNDKPMWYLKPEELDLIVCSEKRQHLTYKQIPARRKTVRLRFQNLKSKVCRPFSL